MCEYCRELKDERLITITDIRVGSCLFLNWNCEMKYCPSCGKRIERRIENGSYDRNQRR